MYPPNVECHTCQDLIPIEHREHRDTRDSSSNSTSFSFSCVKICR